MYSNQTYENIKDRILNDKNINKLNVAKNEGSLINSMVSALSVEEAKLYIDMMNLFKLAFIKEGYFDYLDKRVNEFGVYRKMGEYSKGEVEFKGAIGTKILNGSIIRINGLDYSVIKDVTISAITENNKSPIQANEVGVAYNVPAGSIFSVAEEVIGLESIIATTGIEGGIDAETDEELRVRFYETQGNNATSGNVAHYEQWAKEVDGVYNAKVTPLWNGAGTVKVAIVGKGNKPTSQEVINRCKAYLEEVRPIGATVTVITPTLLNINVTARVKLFTYATLEEAKANIQAKLEDYIGTTTTEVVYSKIYSIIASSEFIKDVEDLKVNNGVVNIKFTDEQLPTINSLDLQEVV